MPVPMVEMAIFVSLKRVIYGIYDVRYTTATSPVPRVEQE